MGVTDEKPSYAPIRRDKDGNAVDPWRFAEEVFGELGGSNPDVLADLVIAAKADLEDLKRRYSEYRRAEKRSSERAPGELPPDKRFIRDTHESR